MVRIRLKRMGRAKLPFYRVVVIDGHLQRDGKTIEEIGWYNPLEKDDSKRVSIDLERAKYWISKGAQPSSRVSFFLKKAEAV